jgi:hypothetical protein
MAEEENIQQQGDVLEIYTGEEMLVKGLLVLGWNQRKIGRVKGSTNLTRFKGLFNASFIVCAHIWEDLQTTSIEGANINQLGKRSLKEFFAAMHFLARYPTEHEREQMWKKSCNTLRVSGWLYINCIRALKADKIKWPSDNFGNDEWALAVDGVQFASEEKIHPTLPKDPAIFSYKHNCAGFTYEFAVALAESRLVWMNGPFDSGAYNDKKIFKNEGLLAQLKRKRKRAIADGGYGGHPKYVSTPNSHDSDEVKLFKRRARQRNEKYNGMLKTFECLSRRFRHSKERLQSCVEAVCVVTEYKMEHGKLLYDI